MIHWRWWRMDLRRKGFFLRLEITNLKLSFTTTWCKSRADVCLCCYFYCATFCCSARCCFFMYIFSTVLTQPCFRSQQFKTSFFYISCVVCCLHSVLMWFSSVIKRAGNWWSVSVSFDRSFARWQQFHCPLFRWFDWWKKGVNITLFSIHLRQISIHVFAAVLLLQLIISKRQVCGFFSLHFTPIS